MNLKKLLISLITVVMFSVFVLTQGTVYAAGQLEKGKEKYMGVVQLMDKNSNEPDKGTKMGYAMGGDPTGNDNDNAAYIWNILRYNSENSDTFEQNKNFYCVKAGIGFTETNNGSLTRRPYNVYYDMKKDRKIISESTNDMLKLLEKTTITDNENNTFKQYNAILAVLDMLYLPGESTELEKKQLLDTIIRYAAYEDTSIGDPDELAMALEGYVIDKNPNANDLSTLKLTDCALTDNDIQAVQQAVIWYFTNYYEIETQSPYKESTTHNEKFDKTAKNADAWFFYSENGGINTYKSLKDYNPDGSEPQFSIGTIRNEQVKVLYNYMINEAKAKASQYDNISSATGSPIRIDTDENLKLNEISGDNYIVGPIKMEEVNTNPYTLDFVVKNNGTEISSYQLLNKDKTPVANGTTVKDLVGEEFYISVPKSQANNLSIDIKVNYNERTMTLWASTTNNLEQPLVEVDKTDKSESKTLVFRAEPEEEFDLALRKFITAVNNQNVPERITLRDEDVKDLNRKDENGKIIATTANYQESKEPVAVKKGDIVTYTFRIYNEGTKDGYVQEITEDIPEGLEFLYSEKTGDELKADTTLTEAEKEAIDFNQNYLWGKFKYDESGEKIIQISSDYLSKENETTVGGNLIPAFGENDGSKKVADLKYKELAVKFKVVSDDTTGNVIRNEAAITDDADKDGKPVDDRDSTPEEWKQHPDHEDDEDHDYIILQAFDLALRKFIIAVSDDTNIDKKEELRNADGLYTRAPVVDTSKLNTTGEDGKLITTAIYNHTKEPILVKPNDIVVYMLRVYNEGDINGYAAEIKDHLPPYLEFVDGEYNKQYGWTISEDGRTATTKYLENSLIEKPTTNEDGKMVLSYKEVPIMCKVKEEAKSNEKITNIADITEYLDENKKPATDRDSQPDNVTLPEDKDLPGYKDNETGSYIPGQQDDDDFEKVIVKIFDLALRKWVTQAIVIENGEQTITQTGHDAWDDPEAVVKVELHRKKLNQVEVKFRYSIRVYNQGEIAGYAKEVTDYIPEGLKFVPEDNPGWTDEGNNVISTRLLENTLLQPGEYADVEVLLTWIKSENNMGVMINTAEISEDYNEYGVPDIDSTPDNQKPGEDDIDDAPVMLSISTGQARIYFTLGFVVLITIAGGIVLIKKFVI